MGKKRVFSPLFLFHLRVGSRLALRRLGPFLAAFLFAFYLFRAEFFFLVVSELGRSGGAVRGGVSALVCWMFARWAAPRVLLGQSGWVRSLPASEAVKRRAALCGLLVSFCPILLAMGFLCVLADSARGEVQSAYLAGLPVLGWTSGLSVLTLENGRFIRPAAFLAAVASAWGTWPLLGAGLGLAFVLDRLSGAMVRPGPRRFCLAPLKIRGLHFLILLRALRWRLLASYLAAVPPFLVTFALLVNNSVTSLQASRARLFCFAMALVIFHSVTAAAIASRRPPWPWSRCLPSSASRRVLADAAFLMVASLPVLLPLAFASVGSLVVIGLGLPVLSLGAAASLRTAPLKKTSALGTIFLYGSLGALILTLFPPACVGVAAAFPFLLKTGVSLERSWKVSRWLELHHLAAGDPHSWSAR